MTDRKKKMATPRKKLPQTKDRIRMDVSGCPILLVFKPKEKRATLTEIKRIMVAGTSKFGK